MMMARVFFALALPCTIQAEYKLLPKDLELRPTQKISSQIIDEEQQVTDFSKINSSTVKQPVNFDTLEQSLAELERIIMSMKEQVSYIRFNKR
jgi:hypothetical protein